MRPDLCHRLLFTAFVAAAMLTCRPAAAGYSFEVFDMPGAGHTFAMGLNERGDVVGSYLPPGSSDYIGFSRTGGTFRSISVPGARQTTATDIDSAGTIVGFGISPVFEGAGFVLPPGAPMQFDRPPGATSWLPLGVNDQGWISGHLSTANARGIGFVWNGQTLETINAPGTTAGTTVRNVNSHGAMVGTYWVDGLAVPSRAFLNDHGSFSDIAMPGAEETAAYGINDAGTIVGSYSPVFGTVLGFVRHPDGRFEEVLPPGATGTAVEDINNLGQLVGYFSDATGSHGFLATPVPEPATWLAWLAGLAALGLNGTVRRARGRRAR